MRYIIKFMDSTFVAENPGSKNKCHFKFTNKMDDATLFYLEELAFYVRDILEMYRDNVDATINIIPVDD